VNTLKECPKCRYLVNFNGKIEDFECPHCGWVLEEEVLEMDD